MTMFRPLSRFGIAGACTGILLAGCYNLCGDEHRGDGLRSAFSVVHASSHSGPGKVKATKFSDYSHEIPVDNAIERDWLSIIDQGKWDNNWDKRDPEYLRQGRKKEEGDIQRPTASRRIILIRHGQYNLSGKGDAEKYLTELGHRQAAATATRLQELLGDSPPDLLIHSTMTRARETFTAFQKVFSDVEVKSSDLLREGAPYPPDPPSKNYRPDHHVSLKYYIARPGSFQHSFSNFSGSEIFALYPTSKFIFRGFPFKGCPSTGYTPGFTVSLAVVYCNMKWGKYT